MSIIVDIDGTIADNTHRQHFLETEPKNWEQFFLESHGDLLIEPVAEIVRALEKQYCILIVTGRSERYRELTKLWLKKYDIEYSKLYMRAEGEYRLDHEIKEEILIEIRKTYNPILAIDDRQSVVDMWRRNGLICLQNEPKYC
jgi:uncharacterized HAD superfamily protein